MKACLALPLIAVLALALAGGCKEGAPPKTQGEATKPQPTTPTTKLDEQAKEEMEIAAALAKLSPEDRKLAELQKFCVIGEERLGAMGKPVKITVKGETVFLCCKGCTKEAEEDADKTLARLKELKAKSKEPAKP